MSRHGLAKRVERELAPRWRAPNDAMGCSWTYFFGHEVNKTTRASNPLPTRNPRMPPFAQSWYLLISLTPRKNTPFLMGHHRCFQLRTSSKEHHDVSKTHFRVDSSNGPRCYPSYPGLPG